MSSQRRADTAARLVLATLGVGVLLAGCSDIYYARRETIVMQGDNARATNEIVQMVDPWPRDSARRDIAFNGDKMQSAVERYRTNKVIPPVNATTSSLQYNQAAQAAQASQQSGSAAAAAPVK